MDRKLKIEELTPEALRSIANKMTSRVILQKHDRPRILAIDFSDSEIQRIAQLGFNVRRGSTGLRENDQFLIPWSIHDVEIAIVKIASGSFSQVDKRRAHANSFEKQPHFMALFHEIWQKKGWILFFIQKGCTPAEFQEIGIERLGVIPLKGRYFPAARLKDLAPYLQDDGKQKRLYFPESKGEAVLLNEKISESKIIEPYLKNATFLRLSLSNEISVYGNKLCCNWLITNESANPATLALKAYDSSYNTVLGSYCSGAILFVPDFADNNVNVAIRILQEIIPDENPTLFDAARYRWLDKYIPQSIVNIRERRETATKECNDTVTKLYEEEKCELEKYSWLLGLLYSTGDNFRDNAASALRHLGFEVDIIDQTLAQGERKKEDLHIKDSAAGYFALGETKSTKRGASESFITDVQNHQGRYSRDNTVPIPPAILIVNHSIDFDPQKRSERFYRDTDIVNRCKEQCITAIDSIALYYMCKLGIEGKAKPENIRKYIEELPRVIETYSNECTE